MPSKDSKSNFAILKEKILQKDGKEYWRSVEEFADTPEFEDFVKYEYPSQAEEWDSSLSRRKFVKVMGASLALAGLSGCVVQRTENMIPYVSQPEGIKPGTPLFFSTAMTIGGVATGLLARSNEGRPTQIEGNPEHPGSLGGTDIYTQASLLNLYDPDRLQEIQFRGAPKTWQSFTKGLRAKIEENRADGGAGIHFLTETITSPTLIDQFTRLLNELPKAKWHQYEPINKDSALAGSKLAFGSPAQALYKFDKAERVLSLDSDFLAGFNVRYKKDFAKARAVSEEKKEMSRLYAVETTLSLVGAKADHRLAVKPSEMVEIAKAIAGALGVSGASGEGLSDKATKWIEPMAKDLLEYKGKSLVVAGDNQPPVIHALAHAMNDSLGNTGQTVSYIEPLSPNADKPQKDQLAELIKDVDDGSVKMLVILGGNPVYNTPSDLKLNKERLAKVPFVVRLGEHKDETGILAHWNVSGANYLESWADSRAYDGTVTIAQPLVKPLYGGKSVYEVVQLFFKDNFEKSDLAIIQEFWQKQGLKSAPILADKKEGSDEKADESKSAVHQNTTNGASGPRTFEDKWRKAVHDGFLPGSASAVKTVAVSTGFLSEKSEATSGSGKLEITILPDPSIYDGRFANNGWLQELPNPLNKITWENVALVSPNTAKELGINQGKRYKDYAGGELGRAFINTKGGNMESDLIQITYQDGKIEKDVPAWIAPGQPDGVITIFLGYGRTRAGKIGSNIGYNAYDVQKSDAMWFGKGDVVNTKVQTTVASTQIHFNMEGRELLRHESLEGIEHLEWEDPKKEYEKSIFGNQFEDVYKDNNRWAMTIDLNSCVGCNACVVACQSENNIPVVGREQVERSREMHWLRIDAYYSGDVSDANGPDFQPVLCQQCEQAPCEVVCPVHATVHSAEGLNDMVYNRCIGTRYCSNNCPYKVRRFNFLLFQDWDTPQYKLMRNPEVTVRSRGVMEKCTYCTQRISKARIAAEREGREVRDGEVITACQSSCPSDAILFGNLNDKKSKIAKMKKNKRNYSLLNEELNTQPRTSYLMTVRNQNSAMPDYIKPEKKEAAGGH